MSQGAVRPQTPGLACRAGRLHDDLVLISLLELVADLYRVSASKSWVSVSRVGV